MKAHIYATRGRTPKGRVLWTYWMFVRDSRGVVVWADNGPSRVLPYLIHEAYRMVGAIRVIEGHGNELRPWADVVDEAGFDL